MSWVFATETITTIPIKKGEARDWFEKLSAGDLDCYDILGQKYAAVDFRLSSEGSYICFRRLEEKLDTASAGSPRFS